MAETAAPPVSVNSLCFPGADLAEMADHWRAVGAHKVSLVSNLLQAGAHASGGDGAQRILDDGGHELEAVTHLFFGVQNLSWDPGTWARERERLNQTIDTAARLGGRSVYLMTGGRARMTWEEAADCFRQAVAPCRDRAADAGINLMIETASPLYAEGHLAHTLRDTVSLAEYADVGICLDIWACWTEAALNESIARAVPRCALVQVSDYVYGDRSMPCRAVPGDGDIPLDRIIGWVLDAGYEGAFDLELIGPRIDAEGRRSAVRRSLDYVTSLVSDLR